MTSPPPSPRGAMLAGAAWLLFAVLIWAGWLLSTRLGVGIATKGHVAFTPWDIAALRYLVAGLLLAPVVWKRGWGWRQMAARPKGGLWYVVLIVGAGAPYAVVVTSGLTFAPAAHGGALLPGTMPLIVAVLAWAILRERIDRAQALGFALIFCGAMTLVGRELMDAAVSGGRVSIGHALFLVSATLWALSTLAMRRSGLAPLHATAVVAVVSMLIYLPPYFAVTGLHLLELPLGPALFHGFYQGVMTSAVSLIAYMRGIALLGPARAAAFGALTPVLVAILGIPLLGEWPAPAAWTAVLLTAIGVVLASGAARAMLATRKP
ncbi:MAG: DMT family transporter [Rhodospirillales bacterium]|nr:DMT family transporter [Rhodospirillales bacterium]